MIIAVFNLIDPPHHIKSHYEYVLIANRAFTFVHIVLLEYILEECAIYL